jgi:hypothetical protein
MKTLNTTTNTAAPVCPTDPLGAALHALSKEQLDQQIDLAKRLLGMAINGTPAVSREAFPTLGIDLALHALLTAYMSLADAYELNTHRAAHLAVQAGLSLDTLHTNRAIRAPSQVQ